MPPANRNLALKKKLQKTKKKLENQPFNSRVYYSLSSHNNTRLQLLSSQLVTLTETAASFLGPSSASTSPSLCLSLPRLAFTDPPRRASIHKGSPPTKKQQQTNKHGGFVIENARRQAKEDLVRGGRRIGAPHAKRNECPRLPHERETRTLSQQRTPCMCTVSLAVFNDVPSSLSCRDDGGDVFCFALLCFSTRRRHPLEHLF